METMRVQRENGYAWFHKDPVDQVAANASVRISTCQPQFATTHSNQQAEPTALYSKNSRGFLRWHPVSKALNAKIDLATRSMVHTSTCYG